MGRDDVRGDPVKVLMNPRNLPSPTSEVRRTPGLRLAIVGPGRAGKDACAEWLAANTPLRYTGSCSSVIAPHAARRLGLGVTEAFARRHEDRDLWRAIGDELRRDDPAALARETLRHGELCVGVRARVEIEAVIRERLVDLVLWIDRDVPPDPTLEFGPEVATVILPNRGTLADLHGRLRALARAWGLA